MDEGIDMAMATAEPEVERESLRERIIRKLGGRVQLDRLTSTIAMYEQEMLGLENRPVGPGLDRPIDTAWLPRSCSSERASRWWRGPARRLLDVAKDYARQRRIDSAWDALHSSQRLTLYDLEDKEIAARAATLRAEVGAKLDGWRKTAALEALSAPAVWPPTSLITAQEILDQHSTNVYLKLTLAGHRIATAAVLLALATTLLTVAAFLGWFAAIPVSGPFVLHEPFLFLGMLSLGIFGAMLSLTLDFSNGSPAGNRIYDFTTTRLAVPLARFAIGAGSAVLTVATAQAIIEGSPPWVFLLAIPAGFSERLVRRSIATLESQIGK